MRDILRLLLGDGPSEDGGDTAGAGAGIWDGRRGRRPSVADSREWCGTEPDGGALGQVARTLRGASQQHGRGRGRGGRAAGRSRGMGPF
jgi:hypothetical protein